MPTSTTQLTLKLLTKAGYTCCVAEWYNSFTRRRHDLFGFIDIVALGHGETIGIQCTSHSNIFARVKKITTERGEQARAWLLAGNKIEVIGWRKVGHRWQPTSKAITLKEIPPPGTAGERARDKL